MVNRRQFLLQTGITAAGLSLGGCLFAAGDKRRLIGIQLYTLRDEIKSRGLKGTLQMLASAGYKSVEMFGFSGKDFFGDKPEAVANLLKTFGLKSPSGHYMLNLFDDNGQQVIDAALSLGNSYIVIPWFPPEQRSSIDDYKRIAEKLNHAAELCSKNKIRLAYHNHEFEFQQYPEGVCGYDILTEEVSADLMDLELDLFWVDFAGRDPLEIFRKYTGRIKMWHVKDRDKANPKINTEIGSGTIDYKKIFAQASVSGLEYFYMEQENFAMDPEKSIQKSNAYIKKNLLPALG